MSYLFWWGVYFYFFVCFSYSTVELKLFVYNKISKNSSVLSYTHQAVFKCISVFFLQVCHKPQQNSSVKPHRSFPVG